MLSKIREEIDLILWKYFPRFMTVECCMDKRSGEGIDPHDESIPEEQRIYAELRFFNLFGRGIFASISTISD